MRSAAKWIVAGVFWLSTCVGAQVATYDPGTNLLSLPAVKVGSDTYTNVTLLNVGNFVFTLQAASPQLPPGPAAITYDGATGVLNIPVVRVGSGSYVDVALHNIGDYTFSVAAATYSSAEGSWKGTTPDGRTTFGVVLDDGSIDFFYLAAGGRNAPGGFVVGQGTSLNGTFSSSNVVEFNFEGAGVLSGTLSASYVTRQSLNATIARAGTSAVTFTAAFDPSWDTGVTLAGLAGTWAGQALIAAPIALTNLTVTISPSGNLSSTDAFGCTRTGQGRPHARGHVYDISYTEGAHCPFAGQTFTGIAGIDDNSGQLIVATTNAGRTTAEIFFGTRR